MQIRDTVTSHARLNTLCSRCHHSEFIHGDQTGGACLFSECKCPRFRVVMQVDSLRKRLEQWGDAAKHSPRTPKRQTVS
jgi:hypothetical protein